MYPRLAAGETGVAGVDMDGKNAISSQDHSKSQGMKSFIFT
jgi:hypothetical protein